MKFHGLYFATAAVSVRGILAAEKDTPVAEVLKLLDDLKEQVEEEGRHEAEKYEKFACFCRSKTKSKSESIKDGQDTIDDRTATIEEKTEEMKEKEEELQERKEKHEKLSAELDETTARFKKDKAEYERNAADLSKALSSLRKAIDSLEDAKGASLLQTQTAVADAIQLVRVLASQKVDPDDPEYQFHSDKLIKLLKDLKDDFQDQSDKLDEEWDETKTAYNEKKSSLEEKIENNEDAMDTLKEDIGDLESDIATAKTELEEAEAELADDSLYLKDLTTKCQHVGKEYDQRTSMRFEELEAVKKAVEIIEEKVDGADSDANERAFLLNKPPNPKPSQAPVVVLHAGTPAANNTNMATAGLNRTDSALVKPQQPKATSFLQRFLARSADESLGRGRQQAVALLQAASTRLRSSVLSAVADSVSKDPFVKIKKLIQNLIQRLLDEAKAEATKNGFCNTELGKAYKERDTRFANVRVLNAEIGELLSKKDSLEDENTELSAELKQLKSDLDEATKLREEEHDENKETVKTAKGGLEAVTEALKILKEFYAKAKKASLLHLAASPVDEDTDGPGFSGSYKGNQNRAGGVVGMMEVIQSDFDRTIRHTTQEEKEAAANFVEFERTSKADIAGRETKHELNEQELDAIDTALGKKEEDLHDEMGVLDDVLKSVEELKPMCLDSGMSYSERREKREEEIDALKSALCILDTDGVESRCQ